MFYDPYNNTDLLLYFQLHQQMQKNTSPGGNQNSRINPMKQLQLNRSKSQKKPGSAQKRFRLRDYMFVASSSSLRKGQKRQILKRQISQKSALKQSLSMLKKKKYKLDNSELYPIIKKQVVRSLTTVIEELKNKTQVIEKQVANNPTNEDLHYLYDLKRIVSNYFHPALKELDELIFHKNTNLINQIINIGLGSINQQIVQEDNESDSFIKQQ